MGRGHPFSSSILKFAAALLLGGLASAAFAQNDPPGRIARLNYSEGTVAYAPKGEVEWTDVDINRPLVAGDKLWTDKGVRSEIQVGSASVRMDGRTQLEMLTLDDQSAQLSMTQGTVHVRVRTLPEGENFEIDTPNLAYRASYPGDYRIDVDPQRGVTRVTILSGTGAVYGDKGQALAMGGGQQITFKGRALAQVNVQEQPPQDNFDRWAAERNRREEQSVAARYVPRDVVGYALLDASGEWRQDATYGPVWFPQSVAASWAPYRSGRWEWIAPWGWTWIDDSPWAFATSHYGRWAMVGTRWAWVPGRMGVRPIYAPALVAFVGNGNSPLAVGGKQTVAWFPLAPGEAWQPTYRATPLYVSSVNANMPPLKEGGYAYQRKPEALTAISTDDFNRGKPSKGSWMHVAANALTNAQVIAPPAMPAQSRTMVARAPVAPPPADIQKVTTGGPTLQQQIDAQRQAQVQAQMQAQAEAKLQAQREADAQRVRAEAERAQRDQVAKTGEARALEQARIAEHLRRAEQLKLAEQQRAEQHRATLEQQQRIAQQEQQRAVEQQQRRAQQQQQQQKLAEQQRSLEQRRVAQQRAELQAKAAEQARREAAARQRELAKREQVAAAKRAAEAKHEQLQAKRAKDKRDDEARRAAHASQVEQARRAAERDAQVLALQRAEREAGQRRIAEEKERSQREAWQKQQQAVAEQFRREQQLYEEQQKKAPRGRPDLRKTQPAEPEVWQRGIPILNPGRTS